MEIKELIYDEDQIINLYKNNHWDAYLKDKKALLNGILNSLDTIGAYDEDKLIGLIRTIKDRETIIYVQDILILKKYQRQGIGKKLIRSILTKYPKVRQIVLSTDNQAETKEFYKSLGFKEYKDVDIIGFYYERK